MAAACVMLSLGLTGCTVEDGGALGLTVDAAGKPVIVVQMCKGYLDGATLYEDVENPGDDDHNGRWTVEPRVTGFSQFSLADGGNGWKLEGSLKPLAAQVKYVIYGWTEDNRWMALHLPVTLDEIARLRPGQIRYSNFDEADTYATGSVEEFKTGICKHY
ncbi:hypothetical protein GCM10009554_51000 [Kribbella koreensis]|uniref:Lipoprotein n=2 Tax=Kribbella TaxID=182639 RepID=A0ABP6Z4S6_9ACTN